jgi:hypothetical protein
MPKQPHDDALKRTLEVISKETHPLSHATTEAEKTMYLRPIIRSAQTAIGQVDRTLAAILVALSVGCGGSAYAPEGNVCEFPDGNITGNFVWYGPDGGKFSTYDLPADCLVGEKCYGDCTNPSACDFGSCAIR